jgi:tyrosyl-tRNA synthetase
LAAGPITLYVGFDPTAESLHTGNLLQILLLKRFQLAGHHPIAVVGGGTGLIGDPSGRSSERQLNDVEVVEEWTGMIRGQLERFLDFGSLRNPARVISNFDWLGKTSLLPFLREIGKHFPVGMMLAKDSVKSRMDGGISYTEFSYMVLQAFDYLTLNELYGCELQGGGSDQWGNITAGVDLVRRARARTVYGLTQPLVTSADGKKLGKSEGGAIWLDPQLTTPYQFYQYWINTSDADVVMLLKAFTFLTHPKLEALAQAQAERPGEREAQRTLAREATTMVHGAAAAARAEKISRALFYGQVSELAADEIADGLDDVPSHTAEGSAPIRLIDLLAEAGIVESKRRAREDVLNGAITVNDRRVTDVDHHVGPADLVAGQFLIIRRGKTNYHLIRWNARD